VDSSTGPFGSKVFYTDPISKRNRSRPDRFLLLSLLVLVLGSKLGSLSTVDFSEFLMCNDI